MLTAVIPKDSIPEPVLLAGPRNLGYSSSLNNMGFLHLFRFLKPKEGSKEIIVRLL